MTEKFKKDLEIITDTIIKVRKNRIEYTALDSTEGVKQFESMIIDYIIPLIKDSAIILGRSGCSINYYSNELAIVHDSKRRIFIQILLYPYGHSKVTMGVNAPFLQFAFSPAHGNIKITSKISLKSDNWNIKVKEIGINDFTPEIIDKYMLDFFRKAVVYNMHTHIKSSKS